MTEHDGIRISNREVFDALVEFRRDWDQWKGAHDKEHELFRERLMERDRRMRGLELRTYGILAGLLGALGLIVSGGTR